MTTHTPSTSDITSATAAAIAAITEATRSSRWISDGATSITYHLLVAADSIRDGEHEAAAESLDKAGRRLVALVDLVDRALAIQVAMAIGSAKASVEHARIMTAQRA